MDPKRYMMKPGLTGLAQINGGRALTTKEKIKYDVEYYDNMSLALDVKIVFTTLRRILSFNVDKLNKTEKNNKVKINKKNSSIFRK